MSDNARFHNKLHRKNHHTSPTAGYPDSATDPIASAAEPFQGDFNLNGNLNVSGAINTTFQTLSNISLPTPVLSATIGFNPTNSLIIQLSGVQYAIPVSYVGKNSAPVVIKNSLSGVTTFSNGISVIGSISGVDSINWNAVTSVVQTNSASWFGGYSAYTTVSSASASWQNTTTIVTVNSANWQTSAQANAFVSSNSATSTYGFNSTVFSKISSQPYSLNASISSINANNSGTNNASGRFSGSLAGSTNTASGAYSIIVGGGNNTSSGAYSSIIGGTSNTAAGCTSIAGGYINCTVGAYSSIIGGTNNSVIGAYSGIVGGQNNSLSGTNAFAFGSNIVSCMSNVVLVNNLSSTGSICGAFYGDGSNLINVQHGFDKTYQYSTGTGAIVPVSGTNSANGDYAAIAGGNNNTATGTNAYIANGTCNTASLPYSSVINGSSNTTSGYASIIINGCNNVAAGCFSIVGNGCSNSVTNCFSIVAAGVNNTTSGQYSSIINGTGNNVNSSYSSIIGGCNNTTNYQSNTHIIGSNLVASSPNYTYVNNLSTPGAISSGLFFGDGTNLISTTSIFGRTCSSTTNNSIIPKFGNNTASGLYSFIAGGSANNTNFNNTFLLGTGLSATTNNYTYVNNISSQGIVATAGGTSVQWDNTSTLVNSNSSNWSNAYTSTSINSAGWNTAYQTATATPYTIGLSAGSIQPISGSNIASGLYSTIAGGYSNIANASYTFVAGGSGNSTNSNSNTFILGSNIIAFNPNYTYVNNLCSFGYVQTTTLATSSVQVASISATTSGPGSVTAKMPIYNAAGNFVGYIPIYTS